jgi:hypothetical protein
MHDVDTDQVRLPEQLMCRLVFEFLQMGLGGDPLDVRYTV